MATRFIIIAASRHQRRRMVVLRDLMTNLGLEKALADMQVPFGERMWANYVIEAMAERQWTLGGETSGHIFARPDIYRRWAGGRAAGRQCTVTLG